MSIYQISKPFDISIRDQVAKHVVSILKEQLDIRVNWSYECGFDLPLKGTPWTTKDYGDFLNNIIKYHNSRQLRFYIDNDKVIGLRCKDEIPYWSDQEIQMVIDCINNLDK